MTENPLSQQRIMVLYRDRKSWSRQGPQAAHMTRPGCAQQGCTSGSTRVRVRQSRARVATWPSMSQHGPWANRMAWVATEFFSVATGLGWPCVAIVVDVTTQLGNGGRSLDRDKEFPVSTRNCGLRSRQ